MSTNDRHIAMLRVRVALWDVLFYCQVKYFLLRMSCSFGIFPDVLCFDSVFLDDERGRHLNLGCQ